MVLIVSQSRSVIVELVETKAAEFEKAVFEYVDSLQF
jgi:hypothetical protein